MAQSIKDLVTNYVHIKERLKKINSLLKERANELTEYYVGQCAIIEERDHTYWLHKIVDMEFNRDGIWIWAENGYDTYCKEVETGYDTYDYKWIIHSSTGTYHNISMYQYDNPYEFLERKVEFCTEEEFIQKLYEETQNVMFKSLPTVHRDFTYKER